MRLPVIGVYPDALIALVYVVTIIIALPEMNNKPNDLLGIIDVLIIDTLSPLFFPDTTTYWEENARLFLTRVLPL